MNTCNFFRLEVSIITSSSAIAERPRCRVVKLWLKVEDWNWETIFTDNIGLYSTTATYLASKEIEIDEKRKIRAITPFKVIQGHRGRYQSKARMRLPIFNQSIYQFLKWPKWHSHYKDHALIG